MTRLFPDLENDGSAMPVLIDTTESDRILVVSIIVYNNLNLSPFPSPGQDSQNRIPNRTYNKSKVLVVAIFLLSP